MTDKKRLDLIAAIVQKGLSAHPCGEAAAYLLALHAVLESFADDQKAPEPPDSPAPEPERSDLRGDSCLLCKCPTCARKVVCDESCSRCSDDGWLLRPHAECERYVQS